MFCSSLHLLIQILPLLFVLEVVDEFFNSVYHLSFGERRVGENGLQFLKEGVDLIHFVAGGLFRYAEVRKRCMSIFSPGI